MSVSLSSTPVSRIDKLRKARLLAVQFAAMISLSCIIGFELLASMSAGAHDTLISAVLNISLACEIVVMVGLVFVRPPFEAMILLVNVLWLLLSRYLLKDFPPPAFGAVRWAMIFTASFVCGACLTGRRRDGFCSLLTLVVAGVLGFWALTGILTVLFGHTFFGMKDILLVSEGKKLVFITFFSIHRNKTSIAFVCAAALLLYRYITKRRWYWKLFLILFLPLSYLTVALQHSRSAYLAYAVLLGLVLVYTLRGLPKWPSGWPGKAAELCVLALCVVLFYTSFSRCSDGIGSLAEKLQSRGTAVEAAVPAQTETSAQVQPKAPKQTQAPALRVKDERDTTEDAYTLTQRTSIWKNILPVLKRKPNAVWLGQPEEKMMGLINVRLSSGVAHMHNTLFQQLMLAGAPGFLLYLVFFLLLLAKCAVCFFRPTNSGTRPAQMLSAAVLAMVPYGVLEPLLSSHVHIASILFCYLAGLFVQEYRCSARKAPEKVQ